MADQQNVPLLPCPFCGAPASPNVCGSWAGLITCATLFCPASQIDAGRESWNRRAFEPPADLIERADWHKQQWAECFRQMGSAP
jgi:hypothetical protein